MMNVVALGLVLTSLVTAGFFSPTPQNPRSRDDDVIVKEGHRVVVVEYEKDDGNTKVLISPHDSQTLQKADGKGITGNVVNAKDKLWEKMEGVKEGVKGASSSVVDEMGKLVGNEEEGNVNHKFRPRELVCDAYGKCKHKIASAFERTKDSAEEAVNEAAGKVKDKFEQGKEQVKDTAETVERVSEKAKDEAARKVEGAKEAVTEKAKKVGRKGQKELRERARQVFDYVAPVAGVVHMMGFAAAYGMCVWITFASSYVLGGALPRQQFAVVQSKIYPVYFKGMACAVGMALLGHLVGPSRGAFFQGLNLAAALGMIITNLMWLEPQATKVMVSRMKKEKEEGSGKEEASRTAEAAGRGEAAEIIKLTQTLQRLNSYSSFLNAFTLVSLTWHLIHLTQRLHAAAS